MIGMNLSGGLFDNHPQFVYVVRMKKIYDMVAIIEK
jgi:hypothetical protein